MELPKVLKCMELRLNLWEIKRAEQRKKGKYNVDVCLIASICDIQEDIISVKRAMRIKDNYTEMFKG